MREKFVSGKEFDRDFLSGKRNPPPKPTWAGSGRKAFVSVELKKRVFDPYACAECGGKRFVQIKRDEQRRRTKFGVCPSCKD